MKKLLIFSFIFAALTSCYEDKSASDYSMINPIMIDMSSAYDTYNLYQLDTVEITPIVYKEGTKDEDLSFEWTLQGNYLVPEVVGTAMSLKTEIALVPMPNPYSIILKVTDDNTGIYVEKVFYINVLSPFGTGLVVADTKDGVKGDLSLIMSTNFNSSYVGDTIMRDLYSRMLGDEIEAPVTALLSNKYSTSASLTIGTAQSVERVNPYDFTYMDKNEGSFVIDPDNYNVTSLVAVINGGYDIILNDGVLHNRSYTWGGYYFGQKYEIYADDNKTCEISHVCKPLWTYGVAFDALNGRFVLLSDYYKRLYVILPNAYMTNPFDPRDFSEYDCLALMPSANSYVYAIMKHKTTGLISNYIFTAYTSSPSSDPVPTKIYNYTQERCPDIDQAGAFTTFEVGGSVYYYVDNKVYCISGSADSDIMTSLEYTAPEGEIVTGIYAYTHDKMGGYIQITNPNPDAAADEKYSNLYTWNKMLMVATYNESTNEGTLRTMGVTNVATGALEVNTALHGDFGGFGRITSISVQQ